MTFGDLGNGAFELFGGILTWQNVRRVRRDKQIRGIDWRVQVFWTSWGVWNLGYYPSLNQWCSFVGGIMVVTANAVWLFYAIRYREK
jgi:hypothetical protein